MTAFQLFRHLDGARVLVAGLKVGQQVTQGENGQGMLWVGCLQQANGVAAGRHPVLACLVEVHHTQQVGSAIGALVTQVLVGVLGCF